MFDSGRERDYRGFMKTTIDLNDGLFAEAQEMAITQQTSLGVLLEEGLRLRLALGRIPVFPGKGGLAPGVEPCSNRAMLNAADDNPRR